MKRDNRKENLRCAIYTRVSTEQGLEQDFNSLDNQREASEAYIASQAQEGWRLIRNRYDDGGFSGGTIDRPALKKLLEDVRARKIDVIVVYKVDRLTRSLADFAKLVELFDEHDVSFISVTQAFNTTTSMGRLTLNMLLSFAQFEREITGERIRDKVAASKRKGIWMGGMVALGYRAEGRALHVVEEHAAFIRELFRRYLEEGSVARLKQTLDRENVRLPVRCYGNGRTMGGGSISQGHLYNILSNPIYIGKLRHKGLISDGLQAAVVDEQTWERVHSRLKEQTKDSRPPLQNSDSFLAGKLFDDAGARMTPSHAAKGNRRWRYYVSQSKLKGRNSEVGSIVRIPAPDIEKQVSEAVEAFLPLARLRLPGEPNGAAASKDSTQRKPWNREGLREAIERVTISRTTLEIRLSDAVATGETPDRILVLPWTPPSPYRRREIIQGEGSETSKIRPIRVRERANLLDALRSAHRWLDELMRDPGHSVETVALQAGKSERSIRMTLSLAFVAPSIVEAAIEGRLPRGFGVTRLFDLPLVWSEQWTAIGLQSPAQV